MTDFFPGFERRRIATSGADINLVTGGSGPPLLLLHGYPQSHLMWRKLAPRFAAEFTVVVPDLRGYGDSSKPPAGADNTGYSKRALALDQVETMAALGFERFSVAGHDRGARVAHRLARDHPEHIERLALLDIVPTLYRFETIDQKAATASYHWFFLIQPGGLPERLIGAEPEFFLHHSLRDPAVFEPEAFAEYLRCFKNPRRSVRPATSTAPVPRSTSCTTAQIVAVASRCRSSCYGASAARRAAATTCSGYGASTRRMSPGTASTAAISCPKRRPRRPMEPCTGFSVATRFSGSRRTQRVRKRSTRRAGLAAVRGAFLAIA
jgi:pimeloyl-ACP methyl ester carboxylesterase